MKSYALIAAVLASTLLAACGSTQYIMSTKEGRLLVSNGKPDLDEKTGLYTYEDADGKKTSVPKSDIVQIMER